MWLPGAKLGWSCDKGLSGVADLFAQRFEILLQGKPMRGERFGEHGELLHTVESENAVGAA